MEIAKIFGSSVSSGYQERLILDAIDVAIPARRITTIIGPNGCGKSTLLRTLARLLPLRSGTLNLDGADMHAFRRRDLARRMSLLPQAPLAPPGVTVADLVSRGRHPHQSWLQQWSAQDEREVADALDMAGVSDLAGSRVDSLSGGQRQRVWIAMVLAQQTDVLFLDEPTTYLDLAAATEILNLVARLNRELERTIVLVLHDLNLAARYSDHLIVMREGAIVGDGTPAQVITTDLLAEVFGLRAVIIEDPITGGPLIVPSDLPADS